MTDEMQKKPSKNKPSKTIIRLGCYEGKNGGVMHVHFTDEGVVTYSIPNLKTNAPSYMPEKDLVKLIEDRVWKYAERQ